MKFKCDVCKGTSFELLSVVNKGKHGKHLYDFPLDYYFPLEQNFYYQVYILTCETCRKTWTKEYLHELEDEMVADGSLIRSKQEELLSND